MSKKEIVKPIYYLPLSQIPNPVSVLSKPGDKFTCEITKSGKKVVKLRTGKVKRAAVQHKPGGKVVETISHP